MDRAAIDWARERVLSHDPAERSPVAVLFLLREYVNGGDAAAREAAELGLTHGLDEVSGGVDPCRSLEWLRALAEASVISQDDLLGAEVRREVPSSIEALEALVRRSYEPGEGLLAGDCAEHLRCASALLAGFEVSGRLPYAMLAEELLGYAQRRWCTDAGEYGPAFDVNCTALSLLCRLAALHADPDYRRSAVLAPGRAYHVDARRLAAQLSARARENPAQAGEFGCALLEWFALESKLQ